MEYLSLSEIHSQEKQIKGSLELLLASKALVGKPKAKQWRFFKECVNRLLSPEIQSEFDSFLPGQAAQLKFELEDKLSRFYLRPGRPFDFVFTMVHKSNMEVYGIDDTDEYPSLAGYCTLIRAVTADYTEDLQDTRGNLRLFIERVIAESMDTEFRAYLALPEIRAEELHRWFYNESPAIKEIMNLLYRHQKKGWIISNPMNPSTKRLLNIKVKKIVHDEAIVNTTEYWYLRWWDVNDGSYTYPYRETNRQIYILKKENGNWKVFENLRPSPRSSIPHRRKKR